jgi:hypothetical protein
MGTDISMYVEIESNGTWQLLTEQDENTELQQREVYYGRQNYRLFAILATNHLILLPRLAVYQKI